MVIDFHTHAFPDAIASRAIETLMEISGSITPNTDGTVGSLIDVMDQNGVDKSVLLNIATNIKQMKKVNDFAAAVNGGRIVSFGSVHPDAPDAIEELYRIKELGLKGIKLHPDYQSFFVDEERLLPLYETIGKLSLITVFHSGVDIGYYDPVHCSPERLSRVLPAFSGAPVVAAHFGGYMQWYDVEQYLVGKNVYFDTGYAYSRMPNDHGKRIVKNHGADKILFGSDMPWSNVKNELVFIKAMHLEQDEENLILGRNAQRLLEL
ncbi:MAG: hypothetical protein BGN88_14365 [Clostridiales bacterium 43-6]|nr:MAG: hypothetical protein BGN88_14365 [Clostridiales bacterium 43-6]